MKKKSSKRDVKVVTETCLTAYNPILLNKNVVCFHTISSI